MNRLNKFEFAFGIGTDRIFREATTIVHQAAQNIDPFYLLSCTSLIPKNGRPRSLDEQLLFPNHIQNNRMMLDSGGFSISMGSRFAPTLSPREIASIYDQFHGPICISPDAPFSYIAFEEALWINKKRINEFYKCYKPDPKKLVYDVIHGDFLHSGNISLGYRGTWLQEMKKHFGRFSNGYAMRLADENLGKNARAYFMLLPWAFGVKNCHLLAAGGLKLLPVLVYLSEKCYDQLTSDAKSYTIDAIHNKLLVIIPEENGFLRPKNLNLNGDDDRIPRTCHCSICEQLENETKTTLYEIWVANKERKNSDNGEMLNVWLMSHNINAVEKYISFLRNLIKDEDAFEEYLSENAEYKPSINAINTIRRLINDGPDNYSKNITTITQNIC